MSSSRSVIHLLAYTCREPTCRMSVTRPVSPPSSLSGVLLASLNPAAVARGADVADAVRIDDTVFSRSDVVGAATSVAERLAGAPRVAVLATPTATPARAVTGCVLAG